MSSWRIDHDVRAEHRENQVTTAEQFTLYGEALLAEANDGDLSIEQQIAILEAAAGKRQAIDVQRGKEVHNWMLRPRRNIAAINPNVSRALHILRIRTVSLLRQSMRVKASVRRS